MGQPARKWIPAKRRAVIARGDCICHLLRHYGCTNGKSIAERFGRREYVRVGRGGESLVRPQLAGSGQTTLDLVIDENCIDLIAAGSKRLQEWRGGYVDAAFTLNGFYNDTAGLFRDQILNPSNVIVRSISEAWHHWGEGFLVFWVGRCGQGTHCTAVKGVLEGNNFVLLAGWVSFLSNFTSEFYGGFIGFAPRIADEDFRGCLHGTREDCFRDDQF